MSRNKILILFGLLLILVTYQNCANPYRIDRLFSVNGTEIGNPGPTNPSPSEGMTTSTQIKSYVCALLVRCRSTLTVTDCQSNFDSVTGVGQALGLPADRYDPFSQVQDAENAGLIVADPAALDNCNQEIASMPCTDSRIDMAYNSTVQNSLDNAALIFPQTSGSCPDVYRETSTGAARQ